VPWGCPGWKVQRVLLATMDLLGPVDLLAQLEPPETGVCLVFQVQQGLEDSLVPLDHRVRGETLGSLGRRGLWDLLDLRAPLDP